jgi:hypothetical protein
MLPDQHCSTLSDRHAVAPKLNGRSSGAAAVSCLRNAPKSPHGVESDFTIAPFVPEQRTLKIILAQNLHPLKMQSRYVVALCCIVSTALAA